MIGIHLTHKKTLAIIDQMLRNNLDTTINKPPSYQFQCPQPSKSLNNSSNEKTDTQLNLEVYPIIRRLITNYNGDPNHLPTYLSSYFEERIQYALERKRDNDQRKRKRNS